ncbi:NAD(P)-binding protein [Dothidotthia symphoricarpi CBS 119687]|uniref:NAD(P)-binding protein n=1 Tax=Dothidotthia symphoricarpi CBS 119687 TaxID=1392245 RepID=A0A6A6A1L8_9PLEO|nr:NAD(P)-binding protein [Dothidotthia symphoricarpi CBS 119687]KAF2125710.1 NAD(P)-binding protein [Dothidotthia symphoricarpi CBS 119687]
MVLKNILITGCSDNGIGSILGQVFHERGYHVFATARNPAKMTWLEGLHNVTPVELDITKPADIKAAVERVSKATRGKLDHLFNNAGRNHFMPVLDVELDVVRDLFESNYFGPLAVTQAFAPLLIKAKGQVSFITSISGYVNTPWMGLYASSKRAIEVVADTLRLELAPFGVTVLTVVTGGVKSSGQTYFDDLRLPEGSLYRGVENTIISRAKGGDGMPRMETMEYCRAVVDEIEKNKSGKFWCGEYAEIVRQGTTAVAVPLEVMDSQMIQGTGLDSWKS